MSDYIFIIIPDKCLQCKRVIVPLCLKPLNCIHIYMTKLSIAQVYINLQIALKKLYL